MLVYCDSVVLIYFFDHVGPFNTRATNRLAAMALAKDQIAVSDLVCNVHSRLDLFFELFRRIAVTQIDHYVRRQRCLAQRLARCRHARRVVIGRFAAAQHDVTVLVS